MTVNRLLNFISGGNHSDYSMFVEVDGKRCSIADIEVNYSEKTFIFKLADGNTVNDVRPGEKFTYKRDDKTRVYMATDAKSGGYYCHTGCVDLQTGEFIWLEVDEKIIEKI